MGRFEGVYSPAGDHRILGRLLSGNTKCLSFHIRETIYSQAGTRGKFSPGGLIRVIGSEAVPTLPDRRRAAPSSKMTAQTFRCCGMRPLAAGSQRGQSMGQSTNLLVLLHQLLQPRRSKWLVLLHQFLQPRRSKWLVLPTANIGRRSLDRSQARGRSAGGTSLFRVNCKSLLADSL
jgi:hypothetical protein